MYHSKYKLCTTRCQKIYYPICNESNIIQWEHTDIIFDDCSSIQKSSLYSTVDRASPHHSIIVSRWNRHTLGLSSATHTHPKNVYNVVQNYGEEIKYQYMIDFSQLQTLNSSFIVSPPFAYGISPNTTQHKHRTT